MSSPQHPARRSVELEFNVSTPYREHEGKWHFVRLDEDSTPLPARLKYIDGYAHFWLTNHKVRFQDVHSWAGPIEFKTDEDLSSDFHRESRPKP